MPPKRGEVWLFDLGMTAKTRPVLVVSVEYGDQDRAIVTVVPHTTEIRQSPFEIPIKASFLHAGAFMVQGVATYPKAWAIRSSESFNPFKWRQLQTAWPRGWVYAAEISRA